NTGTRKQRRNHLERRILSGGADQDDVPPLDVREKGVLLRLVEPVNLVHEKDRALAGPAETLGIGHHGLDLLDAAEDSAERDKLAPGDARDQLRERRLADAGRSPEND